MMGETWTQPVTPEYVTPQDVRCAKCGKILAKDLCGSVELKCRGCKHTQKYVAKGD